MRQTVARAEFAFKSAKKLKRLDFFWKMRLAKCAPYCSENSTWTGGYIYIFLFFSLGQLSLLFAAFWS